MNKLPHLFSPNALDYYQSKYFNLTPNSKITPNKKVVNKKNNQFSSNKKHKKQKQSLAIFKYLIITTSIIFTFGGFGFGFALRCSQDLHISQSAVVNR